MDDWAKARTFFFVSLGFLILNILSLYFNLLHWQDFNSDFMTNIVNIVYHPMILVSLFFSVLSFVFFIRAANHGEKKIYFLILTGLLLLIHILSIILVLWYASGINV